MLPPRFPGRAPLWSQLQALSLVLRSPQPLVQAEALLLSPVQWERQEQELQLQQKVWSCLRQRHQPCLRQSRLRCLAVLLLPVLGQELPEQGQVVPALLVPPLVPG